MDMMFAYIDSIETILKLIQKLIGRHFKTIRIGPLELELRGQSTRTFEETFQKLNSAQKHLTDAVESLDTLRAQYIEENDRLTRLLEQVNTKKAEYDKTSNDLSLTKDLLQKDQDTLKRVLGVNERRAKIAGFISGVLASLLATVIWVYGPKVWPWLWSLWSTRVQPLNN